MYISLYLIDFRKKIEFKNPITVCDDNISYAEELAIKYAKEHGLKSTQEIAIIAGPPDDHILIECIKAEYVTTRSEKVYSNKQVRKLINVLK